MTWEAVGVILTAFAGLLALATAYLRLFVANELNALREMMEQKFVSQKVFDLEMEHIEETLTAIRRELDARPQRSF